MDKASNSSVNTSKRYSSVNLNLNKVKDPYSVAKSIVNNQRSSPPRSLNKVTLNPISVALNTSKKKKKIWMPSGPSNLSMNYKSGVGHKLFY